MMIKMKADESKDVDDGDDETKTKPSEPLNIRMQ